MKIFVLFVEPMLYGMDLIHEVYEKTEYEYQYIYCTSKLTGKDSISLPNNAFVCHGSKKEHKKQIIDSLDRFQPDFSIINGYVGAEQITAIKYCCKHQIPYAIESDTPLHIPEVRIKAIAKKTFLHRLLHNRYCYGFPGGTLQKENFLYYGIPEERNYIMPMSVSANRMLKVKESLPNKMELKARYNFIEKKILLFVGRLEPEKNVGLLIDAYAELKKDYEDIALIIVGDGSDLPMFKKMIKTSLIKDIYFSGYVMFPEIVTYYKMADVFVLPSCYEPWGLVINEAMIMDLPVVVSTAVGCRKDLIEEEKNGFVFKSGDKRDLEKCLKEALNFKVTSKTINVWNYEKYLKNFKFAVKEICKK